MRGIFAFFQQTFIHSVMMNGYKIVLIQALLITATGKV